MRPGAVQGIRPKGQSHRKHEAEVGDLGTAPDAPRPPDGCSLKRHSGDGGKRVARERPRATEGHRSLALRTRQVPSRANEPRPVPVARWPISRSAEAERRFRCSRREQSAGARSNGENGRDTPTPSGGVRARSPRLLLIAA